jgi:lipoprotein NlpI
LQSSNYRNLALRIIIALLISALAAMSAAQAQEAPDLAPCTDPDKAAKPADVIAQCSRLLDLPNLTDKEQAEILNGRGVAYDDAGEYGWAIADYDAAIRLLPDYDEAFNNRGVSNDHLGRTRQAIQDYTKAIALDPEYDEPYSNRAGSYDDLDDHERALADANRAIALDPETPEYFNTRGVIYAGQRDFDRSIQDYDQAIKLKPDYANAFNSRGNAYAYGKGDYEKAIADYSTALKLNPDQYNARWAMGVSLFVLARYAEAETALVEHADRHADDPYGLLLLYLARRHQQHDAADDLNRRAAKLDSTEWPMPLMRLYQGKTSADDLDRSIAATQSLSLEDRCEAAFYMGELDLLSGRTDFARARFQTAVDLCPDDYGELSGARAELKRL